MIKLSNEPGSARFTAQKHSPVSLTVHGSVGPNQKEPLCAKNNKQVVENGATTILHPIANICFRSWFSNLFFFLSLFCLESLLKNFFFEARFYFRPIASILVLWKFVLVINQITSETSYNTILNSTTNTQKRSLFLALFPANRFCGGSSPSSFRGCQPLKASRSAFSTRDSLLHYSMEKVRGGAPRTNKFFAKV